MGKKEFHILLYLIENNHYQKNHLSLVSQSLTTADTLLLVDALQKNNYIFSLDISDNPIGDVGFVMLLKACKRLKILIAERISLTVGLAKSLQSENIVHPALQEFHMGDNPIGDAGFIEILKSCVGLENLRARNISLTAQFSTLLQREKITYLALQKLDVSANLISNMGFVEILKVCPHLDALIAKGVSLTPELAMHLQMLVEREQITLPSLQELDVSTNPISDAGFVGILKVFLDLEKFVAYSVSLTSEFAALLQSEQITHPTLQELTISNNTIGNTGFVEILKVCPHLDALIAKGVSLTPELVMHLQMLVEHEQITLPSLQELDVSTNPFGDAGFVGILKVLLDLKKFVAYGVSLTSEFSTLLQREQITLPSLQELDVSDNPIGDSSIVVILKTCPHLNKFGASNAFLTSEFSTLLQRENFTHSTLRELTLSDNPIGDSSIVVILKTCPRLNKLGASNAFLTSKFATLLQHQGFSYPILQILDVGGNSLGNTGFIALLKICPHLIKLEASNISLTSEFSTLLQSESIVYSTLQILYVKGNPIGNTGFVALLKVCSHLKKLDASCVSLTPGLATLLQYEQNADLRLQELNISNNLVCNVDCEELLKACLPLKNLYVRNSSVTSKLAISLLKNEQIVQPELQLTNSRDDQSKVDNLKMDPVGLAVRLDELLMRWAVLAHICRPARGASVDAVIASYTHHPNEQYHPLGKLLIRRYEMLCQKPTGNLTISALSSSSYSLFSKPASCKISPLPSDIAPLIFQYLGLAEATNGNALRSVMQGRMERKPKAPQPST